jgi:hypothetical protein
VKASVRERTLLCKEYACSFQEVETKVKASVRERTLLCKENTISFQEIETKVKASVRERTPKCHSLALVSISCWNWGRT